MAVGGECGNNETGGFEVVPAFEPGASAFDEGLV